MTSGHQPRTADRTVEELRTDWEKLARNQRFWARGGGHSTGQSAQWNEERFLSAGRRQVEDVVATLRRLDPALRTETALDFGCGVGRLMRPLSESYAQVTGIDISSEMIRLAGERLADRDNVRLLVNTSDDLAQFTDASVDLVHEYVVFQHMAPQLTRAYLLDAFRVLRPGGHLVFTLPSLPRATVGGLAQATLPKPLLNRIRRMRDGFLMQMNPIRHDMVDRFLQDVGFHPPVLRPCTSAGPNWHSFRFYAHKPV